MHNHYFPHWNFKRSSRSLSPDHYSSVWFLLTAQQGLENTRCVHLSRIMAWAKGNEPTSLGTMLQVNARMGGGAPVVPLCATCAMDEEMEYLLCEDGCTQYKSIQLNKFLQNMAWLAACLLVACSFSMFCLVDYIHLCSIPLVADPDWPRAPMCRSGSRMQQTNVGGMPCGGVIKSVAQRSVNCHFIPVGSSWGKQWHNEQFFPILLTNLI